MQKSNGTLLLSASDLVSFVECAHTASLGLINLEAPIQKAEADEQMALIAEKGNEHEAAYLERLKIQDLKVIEIRKDLEMAQSAEATLAAMRDGADIIFQATFLKPPFVGYADFLRKVPRPSALGNYSYEVIDTKLARTSRAKFLVQLSFYSGLLTELQGVEPLMMHVVLGNGDEVNYRVADYKHYVDGLIAALLQHVQTRPATRPEPCKNCDLCVWRDHCQNQWEAEDHLSLVADMRSTQIAKLKAAGTHTLAALAALPADTVIPKLHPDTFNKLRAQAKLQFDMRADGQLRYEIIEDAYVEARGFNRLPPPNAGDIYFDIEGNPLETGGLEYLLGIVFVNDGEIEFKAFWAHNRAEERLSFEAFIDFVEERRRRYPELHIYHYAAYENTAIKRLMSVHGTREAQVDDWLRQGVLVDLYKVVRETVRTSAPGYSLKDIEGLFMPKREGDVTNAGASIVFYEEWKSSRDPTLLGQISDYNEFDCRSTKALHDWLLSLREPGRAATGTTVAAAVSAPAADNEKKAEREAKLARFRSVLVDPLPAVRETWTAEQHLSELIYFLADFYRRAEKPAWWAMFARKDMSVQELIDDVECLGGLELDPDTPPTSEKQSVIYTYTYPAQETKLKVGDSCFRTDNTQSAGTIVALDEDECRVAIKRGKRSGPLPESMSIGPQGPIGSASLVKAMERFVEAYIAGHGSYHALLGFLRKEMPSIRNIPAGQPIIPAGQNQLPAIINAVAGLNESYLFIQGPPGAGKTYTGSRIIVELMRQGKTVGVSSNSHKAINNLLRSVETHAKEIGFSFRGAKKSTQGDSDTEFDGDIIDDVFDNKDIHGCNYQLVAGTAWCFADVEANQTLDYLFVDEAGQVSIANLIAMGLSARNIVLLGDQMQLSQPVQGDHPGRSGDSVLDYLLDGAATIAPERGVFLGTTWRMHPDVCEFISQAVYDGRLHAEAGNSAQCLVLSAGAHPALKPTGIQFVPCEHEDCSQRSVEEAQLVAKIYQSALQQSFVDRDGATHPMQSENILIVAPYNLQVNLLKEVLPDGARVGTVDKFQGQEAELVIVSMATSNEENMPRNMQFLFSRNRLNVALSRARCLSVLVANPQLTRVACTHPQEMALVNTLCWVKNYSVGLG